MSFVLGVLQAYGTGEGLPDKGKATMQVKCEAFEPCLLRLSGKILSAMDQSSAYMGSRLLDQMRRALLLTSSCRLAACLF
jgi:hypothetical protein